MSRLMIDGLLVSLCGAFPGRVVLDTPQGQHSLDTPLQYQRSNKVEQSFVVNFYVLVSYLVVCSY